jgi:dissimilatory sulfite reductase (desulfoviridin) alpha/beta subunit
MSDIGIIRVHRDLPIMLEDKIKICERPIDFHCCPTAAIKAKGKDSIFYHCGKMYTLWGLHNAM